MADNDYSDAEVLQALGMSVPTPAIPADKAGIAGVGTDIPNASYTS